MKLSQKQKAELLETGKFADYRQQKRDYNETVIKAYTDEETLEKMTDKDGNLIPFSPKGLTEAETKACEQMRNNATRQTKKIEDHVKFLMKQENTELYFMTFTFNEETLEKTTSDTRRQKIRRLLKPCNDYILNIDYGTQNEREHYHAIVSLNQGTYTKTGQGRKTKIDLFNAYDYGFYSAEPIGKTEKDREKLSKYITKLTLHSVKVSQQYVSVKKGSNYQKWKKDGEMILRISNSRPGEPIYERKERLYRERETLEQNTPEIQNLQKLFGREYNIS